MMKTIKFYFLSRKYFRVGLLSLLTFFVSTVTAQNQTIRLPQTGLLSVQTITKTIQQQTKFSVDYTADLLTPETEISVSKKTTKLSSLLDELVRGRNLSYQIKDRHIIITKKESLHNETIQQKGTINGKVVDGKTGEPIIGATVISKDGKSRAVTDIDGNFTISTSNGVPLEISYIGYEKQEVKAHPNIRAYLHEDTETLDDVVVVGYGIQKRASVTGAVASVQSKDLVTVKSANVTNSLAGKLPGLRAVQRSGAPGDDEASIDVRGFGSALVIVDGVERDFSQLDPNDIESISILKDASAAVYGFKGANGVILVKTKSGEKGAAKINYSGYYGFQKITRYPELYNGYEYATLYNEAQANVGVKAPYSEEELANFRKGIGTTNWYDETIKKSAPQTYHNISISGGAEKVKYYFSFGLLRQEGILKSNDWYYNKFNIRSNVSATITKGLTIGLQLSGLLDKRTKPYETDPITRRIQLALPVKTIYANNNSEYWNNPGDMGNPVQLSRIGEVGYSRRDRRVFNGSVTIDWDMPWIKGLTAKALFSYDFNNVKNRDWYKEFHEYTYDENKDVYNETYTHNISELTSQENDDYKFNGQFSLNYHNTFGQHDVTGLLLWEFYNGRGDWLRAYRQFDISAIDQINAGNTTNLNNGGNANENAHEGLVGRVNYAYANKYLAEFSFRYDGSYKFSPSKRWGFFPAISLGWRISEEKFFKSALPMFDNLKIRGSWGKIGDETGLSAFQFLSGYTYPSKSYVIGTNGSSSGASDKGMPNVNLTWYKSKTFNIGFEASVYRGLLSVEFDYFIRKRSGLLATRLLSLPTTFGISLPQENLNSDKTKGFELVLGHHHSIRDFSYDIKANFSTTRNYNRYIERAASANMYENWRNNSNNRVQGIVRGKVALGQFQSYEEILNSPIQDNNGNKSLQPGDVKFEDWNHDGIIDDKDNQPIGRGSTPHMYYGLNMSGSYKNFDVTIFFQGAAGHDVFLTGDFAEPFIQQGLGNGVTLWLDRWHRIDPSDPSSEWIPGKMPSVRPTGFSLNEQTSTWNRQKADYLRLKTLEIGYTLPKSLIKSLGIQNLRFYINGFNILTITSNEGMMKWMDPENSVSTLRYYPQMKSYNFGVNLTI